MKKFLRCVFVLLFLAVCALGIFFIVDYSRASEGKTPIFCLKDSDVNDGGTTIYKGAFYKVIDYHKTINYSKNIFYDDIKIGSYAMQYEDYEAEWNKLIEEHKENEYTPVSTDQQTSIKDLLSGVAVDVKERLVEIETIINNLEFRADTIVDSTFQYELFISSKNETYELTFNEENEVITDGLIRARSDLSYAILDADTAKILADLIQVNLK